MVRRGSGPFSAGLARAGGLAWRKPAANADHSRALLPLAPFRLIWPAGQRFRPQLGQVVLATGHRIDLARLRACTHKSSSRVRFRATRTSSRQSRMTEADLPSTCQPLMWGGQKCDVPTPPLRIRAQQRSLLHSSLQRGSAISMTSYYRQRAHRIRDWSQ